MNNDNLIVIRSVYKITEMLVEPAKHPITGRYPDCVRLLDSNGNMILSDLDRKKDISLFIPENQVIKIFDGKTFNLDDPYQQNEWEAIKYSKRIAKARDERDAHGNLVIDGNAARYGLAEFYVEIPGLEAKEVSKKKRRIHVAETYVYNDTFEGLVTKAKVLNLMPNGLSFAELEQMMIKQSQTRPDQVIDLYEGKETYYRILIVDAIEKNVFVRRDKLLYYGDILIGSSDESVVAWLRDPERKTILEAIRAEVYGEEYVDRSTEDSTESTPKKGKGKSSDK